ncbi:YceI family protein [Pseudarthrobacter sulfonivorans]|uniref:YceI family protein n=1 Tax=Pseudarthrobacter sulfonivorans TaxID=121292 RepID=UPI00168C09AB|nr:YceI family protein [Pseudarthrobacter sulfonivorans]
MADIRPEYAGQWRFDPAHTRIGFSTRHAMVTKVRGAFNDVEGTITVDPDAPERSGVQVSIKVASIDTRNADRDQHLRTNDFFDAPRFPEITFVSDRVDQVDEGHFIVSGGVTIRGITREVSIPIDFMGVERDPMGNLRAGFEGSRRINRQDFGLKWNTTLDSGGVLVSDKITLEFEVSAIKVDGVATKEGATNAGE